MKYNNYTYVESYKKNLQLSDVSLLVLLHMIVNMSFKYLK